MNVEPELDPLFITHRQRLDLRVLSHSTFKNISNIFMHFSAATWIKSLLHVSKY